MYCICCILVNAVEENSVMERVGLVSKEQEIPVDMHILILEDQLPTRRLA